MIQFTEEDKKRARATAEKIESSKVFMSIVSENYLDSAECALQMGFALLMDKPIGLLVIKGAKVPEHLKKVAFHIEYVDMDDKQGAVEASSRLLKKAAELNL